MTEVSGTFEVICSCNHLTSFAVLMSFERQENKVEEIVSQILLGLSLACLVLTLIAILPDKKNRRIKITQINLMLVLALLFAIICFFLMDFFVSSTDTSQPSIGCSVIAFLLNYFWLCQLSWMIIEAVSMYMALVRVFGSYVSRALLKYSVLGWGVPLLFPIIAVAWGGTEFADPKTCFVKRQYGLVSFYGPVVVGIVANWTLFVFIARVVLSASRTKAQKLGDTSTKMRTKQFQAALAVSCLLGLSWIVGFFLIANSANYATISTVLRWIFILLNAPQGIMIFLFYVVLKDDVRNFWFQKYKRVRRSLKIPISSDAGRKGDKSEFTSRTTQSTALSSTVISNYTAKPYTAVRQPPPVASRPPLVTKIKDSNSSMSDQLVEHQNIVSSSRGTQDVVIIDPNLKPDLELTTLPAPSDVEEVSEQSVGDQEERIYCDPDELDEPATVLVASPPPEGDMVQTDEVLQNEYTVLPELPQPLQEEHPPSESEEEIQQDEPQEESSKEEPVEVPEEMPCNPPDELPWDPPEDMPCDPPEELPCGLPTESPDSSDWPWEVSSSDSEQGTLPRINLQLVQPDVIIEEKEDEEYEEDEEDGEEWEEEEEMEDIIEEEAEGASVAQRFRSRIFQMLAINRLQPKEPEAEPDEETRPKNGFRNKASQIMAANRLRPPKKAPPKRRTWRTRPTDEEGDQDGQDSSSKTIINKHGSYYQAQVKVLRKKDSTIDRKMLARLRLSEKLEPV